MLYVFEFDCLEKTVSFCLFPSLNFLWEIFRVLWISMNSDSSTFWTQRKKYHKVSSLITNHLENPAYNLSGLRYPSVQRSRQWLNLLNDSENLLHTAVCRGLDIRIEPNSVNSKLRNNCSQFFNLFCQIIWAADFSIFFEI